MAAMGTTNFRQSLEKRYAALTGMLEAIRANIDHINREIEKLTELEEERPESIKAR